MPKKLLKTDEGSLVFYLLQRPPYIRVFSNGVNQLRWPAAWLEAQPREDDDDLYERLLTTLKEWEEQEPQQWYMRESTSPDAALVEGFLTPTGKAKLAARHSLEVPQHQPPFQMMDAQMRYR